MCKNDPTLVTCTCLLDEELAHDVLVVSGVWQVHLVVRDDLALLREQRAEQRQLL